MEVKMMAFGQRLKQLRNEKNLTQKYMAGLLEKTDRHYLDMESGKVNIPALTLMKLADFFDVSIDYLVGRDDRRKP